MDVQNESRSGADADAALVNAINAGETHLFPKLVKRYEQKLFRFGFRMCNNAGDAEDLVQETFLNIFRYMKTFRFESTFQNWIYKIASRICLKKRKKSKSISENELSLDTLADNFRKQTPQEMPGWAKQPIDSLLTHELTDILNKTISSLPAKYRIVLVLRDLEGLSVNESAEILGISEGNIKVRLHRARLHLRDQLQGYLSHAS